MNPTVSSVTPGLSILSYRTELFKAGLLSLTVTSPVAKGEGMLSSLLFSVLRRGCVRYPTLDALNRRLDYLYGTDLSLRNFSRGDRLLSGVALDLLDPSYLPTGEEGLLREALEVVRELLFFPLLDGEGNLLSRYVESEKQHLCDRIRARRSNPAAYAVHRCRELLFSEDPTGALYTVTEEEVMAVTPAALTAFYHRYLSSMHLQAFYVGPREGEEILSVLEEIFGDLVKTPRATLPPTAFVRAKERPQVVRETLPVTQGHLVMAWTTATTVNDPLFFACKVFNEMLGGTPVSRLFLEVRERRSLCYSCYSSYEAYKGVLLVVCGLENEADEEARRAILSELDALCRGEFTDAEIAAAKQSLANIYRQTEDNPATIENFYLSRASADASISVEECARRTAAVTREEILQVAERLCLSVDYFLEGTLGGEEDGCDEED